MLSFDHIDSETRNRSTHSGSAATFTSSRW
jgi:hypothetical protein